MEPAPQRAAKNFDAETIVRQHQAGVWRYLRAMGCQSGLAEDLTQETFLRVLQRPFDIYDDAATASYLRRVAYSLLVSHHRREMKKVEIADFDMVEQYWVQWIRDDSGTELLLALRECLEYLSPRVRDALTLKFQSNLSRTDIGKQLGMSEHGAKNLIQRAKQKLRDCVKRKMRHAT